jgi:hypothetical protein
MTNKMMLMTTARAEALFASTLLTGSRPGLQEATTMINAAVRRYHGVRGCAVEMAGAFGDSPEAAVRRMRWACEVTLTLFELAPSTTTRSCHTKSVLSPRRVQQGADRVRQCADVLAA